MAKKKDPEVELLDLRALLGDILREELTGEDLRDIVAAAVADAKLKDNPSASKARAWLLALIDALTTEDLASLRSKAGVGQVFLDFGESKK